MEQLPIEQQKVMLIKDVADLKKSMINKELSSEEFDELYDMPVDDLIKAIINLKTLKEFQDMLMALKNRL